MPARRNPEDVPPNVRDKALYRRERAKVKSRVRVWPSAYASGQLVQSYKRAGGRYYNPSEALSGGTCHNFERDLADNPSGLDKWFGEKWVDLGRSVDSRGHVKSSGWVQCGRPDSSAGKYPKCVPLAKAKKMTPSQRLSAIRRKRQAERGAPKGARGRKPIMVQTLKNPEKPIFYVVFETPRATMVDSSYERAGPAIARRLELEASGIEPVDIVAGPQMKKIHAKAKREGRMIRHTRARHRVGNPRNSLVKDALRAEAIKHRSFDRFADRYWNDCARGLYWVSTDDPKFKFGKDQVDLIKAKRFYVYCNPEQAIEADERLYVAELNVTHLPASNMTHTRGGKGVEIKISGEPGRIQVLRVLKNQKALRSFRYQQGILPSSRAQLYKFWEDAWEREEKRREKEAKRQKKIKERERARKEKIKTIEAERRERAKKKAERERKKRERDRARAQKERRSQEARERREAEREAKEASKKVAKKASKKKVKKKTERAQEPFRKPKRTPEAAGKKLGKKRSKKKPENKSGDPAGVPFARITPKKVPRSQARNPTKVREIPINENEI